MKTCLRDGSIHTAWRLAFAACVVVLPFSPATVSAQGTLGYSFEGGLQGWTNNPGSFGTTVMHDPNSNGATEGEDAMKISVVGGATFEGALTINLDPNDAGAPGGPPTFNVGDPPGFDLVIFDLTLEEPQPFPGTFVSLGVTVFGDSQPDYPGGQLEGLQAQFQDNEVLGVGDLEAGTHQIVFNLSSATHPLTFAFGQSFNEIFGTVGSGPNDIIPISFQIYINKEGGAANAWVGIFDNIRFADALPGDFNNNLVVDGLDFLTWQRGGTDPPLDPADLALWEANYGSVVPLAAAVSAVPEPGCVALLLTALGSLSVLRRKRLVQYSAICM
jgi:hypothetical protein